MKYILTGLTLIAVIFCSCSDGSTHTTDAVNNDSAYTSDIPEPDTYFVLPYDTISSTGPSNITRDILQDKNGTYWLASWEGIYSYDGKVFTNETLKHQLKHYRAFSLLEDSKGNIWFGMLGIGLYRYDGKEFTNISQRDGLVENHVQCIFEDAGGVLWFGTNGGVSRYDGNTFQNITPKENLTGEVHAISQDDGGTMWFGTDNGVFLYDGKDITPYLKESGVAFSNVRDIQRDNRGHMWIGGSEGLFWCHLNESGKFGQVYLMSNFVSYITLDHNDNLLLSTGNKNPTAAGTGMLLYRYDGEFHLLTEKNENNDSQIFGSIEDRDGKIWFGTMQGIRTWSAQ